MLRSLLVCLIIFSSFASAACPELAGVYNSCEINGQYAGKLFVSQQNSTDIVRYGFSLSSTGSMRHVDADGKTYVQERYDRAYERLITTTTKTWCESNVLKKSAITHINGEFYSKRYESFYKSKGKLTQKYFQQIRDNAPTTRTWTCK